MILDHRSLLERNGYVAARRKAQALDWMRELVGIGLEDLFRRDPQISDRLAELEEAVGAGRITSFAAARELLSTFR